MAAALPVGKHEVRLPAGELDKGLSGGRFLLAFEFMRNLLLWALALAALPAASMEQTFNFGEDLPGQTPPEFRSSVAGEGKPGDWKVIEEEVPPAMAPLTAHAPPVSHRGVLAQLARDPVNNHFPILIYDRATYDNFTLTTRFKIAGGAVAQMAGLVFRFQDERNFYVLLASALDGRFWFYKVVDGVRGPLIGPEVAIHKGEWHGMTVECEGNHIHCLLDGKELIPMLTDNSFLNGKIGFWTKSDSVSYFSDTKVSYVQRESLAERLVKEQMKAYPHLVGLKSTRRPMAARSPRWWPAATPRNWARRAGRPNRM